MHVVRGEWKKEDPLSRMLGAKECWWAHKSVTSPISQII